MQGLKLAQALGGTSRTAPGQVGLSCTYSLLPDSGSCDLAAFRNESLLGIVELPSQALPGAFCGRVWQGAVGVSLALTASHTQVAIGGSGAEALRESGQTCFPKGRVGRCEKEGAKSGSGPRVSLEHAGTTESTRGLSAICFPS